VLLLVSASTPTWLVAALMIPLSVGVALTVPPLTAAMLEAVPEERAGLAAGVLNAARQVAGGLAVAAFGALVAGRGGFASGMREALLVSAGLLALTSVATARLRVAGRGCRSSPPGARSLSQRRCRAGPGQLAWPALPMGPIFTAAPEPSEAGSEASPGHASVTVFVSSGGVTIRPVMRTPEPPVLLNG
jgi:MFS family permease